MTYIHIPASTILDEIANPDMPEKQIAMTYGLMMRQSDTPWAEINKAIIERCGMTGLLRVKKSAARWMKGR